MARSAEHVLRILCLGLALLCAACGDPQEEEVQAKLVSLREALAVGDHSGALQRARSTLVLRPESPEARLGAAEACIGLQRFGEAAEHASAGLPGAEGDAALTADLQWALGTAHLALFLQLKSPDDWRAANSALERGASASGSHRAEAAYSLVRMQGLDGMGSDARRDKFGRMFLQLEPSGERADTVTELMGGGGSR